MDTKAAPWNAVLLLTLIGPAVSGCSGIAAPPAPPAEAALRSGTLPEAVPPVPAGGELEVAKRHFRAGDFGYAARYYQQVVARERGEAEGWLGLAAAYDRLGRFDLADRAYIEAAALAGGTAAYHNNVGFSYLLRGEPAKARRSFVRALDLEPESATVRNNLELVGPARTSGRGQLPSDAA